MVTAGEKPALAPQDVTRVCPAVTQRSNSDRAEFLQVLQTTCSQAQAMDS